MRRVCARHVQRKGVRRAEVRCKCVAHATQLVVNEANTGKNEGKYANYYRPFTCQRIRSTTIQNINNRDKRVVAGVTTRWRRAGGSRRQEEWEGAGEVVIPPSVPPSFTLAVLENTRRTRR